VITTTTAPEANPQTETMAAVAVAVTMMVVEIDHTKWEAAVVDRQEEWDSAAVVEAELWAVEAIPATEEEMTTTFRTVTDRSLHSTDAAMNSITLDSSNSVRFRPSTTYYRPCDPSIRVFTLGFRSHRVTPIPTWTVHQVEVEEAVEATAMADRLLHPGPTECAP